MNIISMMSDQLISDDDKLVSDKMIKTQWIVVWMKLKLGYECDHDRNNDNKVGSIVIPFNVWRGGTTSGFEKV